MKAKIAKIGKKVLLALIAIVIIIAVALAGFGIFYATYTPSLTFDFNKKTGDVGSYASGYLYGVAQDGVPSREMVESIDVSSISQKTIGGLQHPIGDIEDVEPMLSNTDYNVVYLQDIYDTWYYLHDDIMTMRQQGTYDWQKLLDEDYLPKVAQMVTELSKTDYSDKIVYCLYNEADNGIWFGESIKDENPDNQYGYWCDYNQVGMDNFNSAWKQTYDLVKSINPDAIIGGPGWCDYETDETLYFLEYCVKNDCVPDIMIYHELSDWSIIHWDLHIEDYRNMEKDLGISPLPIIVTEYGRMIDNGIPGKMIYYISCMENSKVYGNNAYWRLANNLNDVCADDNSPNSNWWLMRWYTDLEGQTVEYKFTDTIENLKSKFQDDYDVLADLGSKGVAAISDDESKIDIIAGGDKGDLNIKLKNLDNTAFDNQTVKVTVEETVYTGLYGIVNSPVTLKTYTTQVDNGKLNIQLDDMDIANAYHIVVTPATQDDINTADFENANRPVRYEFEDGKLLGDAYTYDSYCPATFSGENENNHDLVGGMEKEGDGVELKFKVEEDGAYQFQFVYGNSNDGPVGDNGKQNPNDRTYTQINLEIDGEVQVVDLANTIKSEYTSCYIMTKQLSAGKHTVKITHNNGTHVLDSLVVTKDASTDIAFIPDADRTSKNTKSFLVISPADSYYTVSTSVATTRVLVDGAVATTDTNGDATVYLRRGLNYVDVLTSDDVSFAVNYTKTDINGITLLPTDAVIQGVTIQNDSYNHKYISGISCNGGSATYSFNAQKAGDYRVTVTYANNDEGGVHDYNVDLIERYISVDVNGSFVNNVYTRNTYSWHTYKTVTFNVSLNQGTNTIKFYSNGDNKFNSADTFAPYISTVTVNSVQA